MSEHPLMASRRAFLTRSTVTAGAAMLGSVAATAQGGPIPKDDGTVRDRLWIWTHPAGSHNYIKLADGSHPRSRMTPVEGALYLGLRNLYFVHYNGRPTFDEYEPYVRSFRSMKRVIWSLTGMGGATSPELRRKTIELARRTPNITGFILDDFLHYNNTVGTHWLAENDVDFPVILTLTTDRPVRADRLRLRQSEWQTQDYRTADIEVETSVDGRTWKVIAQTTMPRQTGGIVDIPLKPPSIAGVRIRVLGTHDDQPAHAKSCGLRAAELYNGNTRLPWTGWRAEATSSFDERFTADNLLQGVGDDQSHEPPVHASMTPDQLAALRPQLDLGEGRRLPLISVVYTHQMSPRIRAHVQHVDQVAMWTWKSAGLADLEANFETMRQITGKPIVLGCYMYDYGFAGDDQPMPVDRMQHQCELGLKWLKQGKIEGMIFLASNVCDLNLEAVEWTRRWIANVGDQRL